MIGGLNTTPGDYIVLIKPQFTCTCNIYLWLMHVLERTFFGKKFNEGCSCIKNNIEIFLFMLVLQNFQYLMQENEPYDPYH